MMLEPNKTILTHINTGRDFLYLGTHTPQFSKVKHAKLKNLKTGVIEYFMNSTYLNYFKEKLI